MNRARNRTALKRLSLAVKGINEQRQPRLRLPLWKVSNIIQRLRFPF